jgi:WD40 repeat protein
MAIGRANGALVLQSTHDALPRFEVHQPYGVSCLSWRPKCTTRPSKHPLNPGVGVQTEDLLLGDETGTVYYYVVEWPSGWEVTRDTWPGTMVLVAKISIHDQQIYGLAWSPDGNYFASKGNDDICCLFDIEDVLGDKPSTEPPFGPWGPSRTIQWTSASWQEGVENDRTSGHRDSPGYIHNMTSMTDDTEFRAVRTTVGGLRTLWPGSERHC